MQALLQGKLTLAQATGLSSERASQIASIGLELLSHGRHEEARVLFEGLVAGNPHDRAASLALGSTYRALGRDRDALAVVERLLEQSPDDRLAQVERGELRLRLGDDGGLADLTAVASAPSGEPAAIERARALLDLVRPPTTTRAPGPRRSGTRG